MKRIIALLLCLLFAFPFTASIAMAEEFNNTNQLTSLMKDLEIMSGDENGNFNLDDKVTRAEFAKLVF